MKPSQLARVLTQLVIVNQPAMIWGPPGIGKSNIPKQVAAALKREFNDLRLPLMDTVDLRGIPINDKGTTRWMRPSFLPRIGRGIMLLDEIVQATPSMQAAASQLILDRRCGEHVIGPEWYICGAGNRENDRAAVNKMPSHIANRFTHLTLEIDHNDWQDWAIANNVNPMVRAFIAFRPEMLHQFDPAQKAFPSPRSWEFVSNILNDGDVDECLQEIVAGTVGAAASTEFVGFVRVFRELPDYDDIVARPKAAPIPDNAAARYATAAMLNDSTQQSDMKAVLEYVARLPKEFEILAVVGMTKKHRKLAETSAYITWCANNKALLLNASR